MKTATWHLRRLSYRQMAMIPLILAAALAASAITLGVPLGLDLKGGTLITVTGLKERLDQGDIESAAKELLGPNFILKPAEGEPGTFGFFIETDAVLGEDERVGLKEIFNERLGIPADSIKLESMGSVITSIYWKQARDAVIGAAIAVAAIVLIAFRRKVAVGSILLAVGLDALGALGLMAIFRVPLSLASIAGLLVLIGYAVDTNILLSTKVLKGVGGDPRSRAEDAMRTGLMMSLTTLVVLLVLNSLTTAPQLHELSAALIFGIIADVVNTWFLNAGILLRHAERPQRRGIYVVA